MELNDTRSVSLTSSLFRGFVFVADITENPDSHKYGVGNGSRVFNDFMARSGYFGKSFIQNIRRGVVSKTHFKLPSFAMSSSWPSCRTGKVDSLGLKINGLPIHFF